MRFFRFAFREGLWRVAFRLSRKNERAAGGQDVLRWDTALPPVAHSRDLAGWLQERGVEIREGGHTIYIPPQPGLVDVLGEAARSYPAGSGFKILRDPRPPHEAHYLTPHGGRPLSTLRRNLVGLPREQVVTANHLYVRGLGPRVWDVCSLRAGPDSYTAFIVDHITGSPTTPEEWGRFRDRLDEVVAEDQLAVTIPDWRSNGDFGSPDCRGNLIATSPLRAPLYVDFQNFRLRDQRDWQREVARKGRAGLHFGRTRVGRGGAYLYQSIPTLGASGKRNSSKRWQLISKLLADAGLAIRGRLVLDVGCNAGMMLHSALADGAFWGLGWDLPEVIERAEPILLSLGTSRFHLIGANLASEYPLEGDVRPELTPRLEESVIFYLSVVNHVGVMHSLSRLPWRAMLFEGHQGESLETTLTHVSHLTARGVRIAARTSVGDGDSSERPLLLLVRDEQLAQSDTR